MTIDHNARKRIIDLANLLSEEDLYAAIQYLEFLSGKEKPRQKGRASQLVGKYSHAKLTTGKWMKEKQKEIDLEEAKHLRNFGK